MLGNVGRSDLDSADAVCARRQQKPKGVVLRNLQLRGAELEEPSLRQKILEEGNEPAAFVDLFAKRQCKRDWQRVFSCQPGAIVAKATASPGLFDDAYALTIEADLAAAHHRSLLVRAVSTTPSDLPKTRRTAFTT